ncbi:uncharacterized protein LOC578539 isoform X4 [Strongylocentrotus purpuratus]|uniref:CRAL-TRIO domain-containing protein n=1 Tax=Strongylocentrotus purpuratus TaxID=7668 RepID=A0A7M7MZJ2_STRPU|nr:uncharacterized protein LOC578539 isoform X4 [Strongylocentrotus purpuratus]
MNDFLRKAKQASQNLSSFSKVHVVIGNEACDLDSTVSAITHAYHLSQDSDSDVEAIIPVLNIPQDEVPLRTETTHLLPRCNIQLTDLVCKDDIDLKSILNLTLTLVDHNVPADSDTWLDQYVVEVIDHRVNSRHDDEDRVISITREMVGSCCTLVARQILDKHLEILDHQLVKLLLGTILLDTLNLSEAAGRTTPTDEDVVTRLGNLSPRINLQELFNEVQAAKFNISGLTTAQMLRKDFKSTSSTSCKVGFSSVTLPLQDVLDRQDLETSLKNFCEHRFLDVNIIMTIDLEGTRQLAIYSEDQSLRETMEERLQGSVLDLERIDSNVSNLSAFDQQNRKASRKVVLPLVGEILRTLGEGDHDEDDEHGENGLEENVEELSSNVNNANDMAEEEPQNGKVMPDEWGRSNPESLHEIDSGNDKIESSDQVSDLVGIDLGAGSSSANPFVGSDSTDLLGGNPFNVMTGSVDEGGDDSLDPLFQSMNKVHDPTQSIDDNNDPFGLSLDPFSAESTPRPDSNLNSSNPQSIDDNNDPFGLSLDPFSAGSSPGPDSNLNSSNPFQMNSDPFSNNDNLLIPTSDPNSTTGNPFMDDPEPSPSLLDLDPITPDNPEPADSTVSPSAQSTGVLLGSFLDPISISSDLPSFVDNPDPTRGDSSSSQFESQASVDDLMSDSLNDQYDLSMTKSDPSISFSDSLAQVPDGASTADENSISISDPCLTITESKDIHEEQPEVVGIKSPVDDSDPFSLSQTIAQKSSDQFHTDDPFGMYPFDVQAPSANDDQIKVEGEAMESSGGFDDDFGMVSMNESSAVDSSGTMGSTPAEDHHVSESSALESAQRQTSPREVEVNDENDLPGEEPVTEDAVDSPDHISVEGLTDEGKVDSEVVHGMSLSANGDQIEVEGEAMENSGGFDDDFGMVSMNESSAVDSSGTMGSTPAEDHHVSESSALESAQRQTSPREVEVNDENDLPGEESVTEDALDIELQSNSSDHISVEGLTVEGKLDSEDVNGMSLSANDDEMEVEGEAMETSEGFDDDFGMVSMSELSAVDPSGNIGSTPAEDHYVGESSALESAQRQTSPGEVKFNDESVLPGEEPVTEDAVDIELQSDSADHISVEDLTVEGEVDSEDVHGTSLSVGESILQEFNAGSDANVENLDPNKVDPFGVGSHDNSPDNQSDLDPFGMPEFIGQTSVVNEEQLHDPFSALNDSQDPALNKTENQTDVDPFGMSPFEEVQSPPPFDVLLHHDDDIVPISEKDEIHLGEQVDTESVPAELHGVSGEEEEDGVSIPKTPRNSLSESSVAEEEDDRRFSQELNERELSARFSHLEDRQSDAEVNYEDDFEEDDVFPTEDQEPEQMDVISGNEEDFPDDQSVANQLGEDSGVEEREIVTEELVKGHEVSNVFASPSEIDDITSRDAVVTGDEEVPVVEESEEAHLPHDDTDDLRSEDSDETRGQDVDIQLFNIQDNNYIVDTLKSNMVDNAVDINTINSGDRIYSDDEDDVQHSPRPVYRPEVMEPNPDPLVYIQAKETEGLFEKMKGEPNHVDEMIFEAEHGEPVSSYEIDTPPFHSDKKADDSMNIVDTAVTSYHEVDDDDDIVIEEMCSPVVTADLEASPVQSDNAHSLHPGNDETDLDDSKEDVNHVADMLAKSMVENAIDIHTYQSRDEVVDEREDIGMYNRTTSDYRQDIMEPNPDPSVYIQAQETEHMFASGRGNEGNHIAEMLADDMCNEARGKASADGSVLDSSDGMSNNEIPDVGTSDLLDISLNPQNESDGNNLAKNEEERNNVADMITDEMVEEVNADILAYNADVGSSVLVNYDVDEMPDVVPNEEQMVDLDGVKGDGDISSDTHANNKLFGDEISPVLSTEVQALVPDELNLLDSQHVERTEDDQVLGEKGNVVADILSEDMILEHRDDQANIPEEVAISLREDEFSIEEANDRDVIEDEESGFKEEDDDDDNVVAEMLADDITFEEGESMMSTPDLLFSAKTDLKDDFFQNISNAEHSSPQGSDDEDNAIVAKDTFEDQPFSESDEEESRDQIQADEDGFIDIENDWSPNDIKVELSTEQYTVNDTLTMNKLCATTGTPLSPLPEESETSQEILRNVSVTSIEDVCIDSTVQLERENEKVSHSHESYSEDEDWEEDIQDHDEIVDLTPDVLSVGPEAIDILGSSASGVTVLVSNETENGSDAGHGDDVMDSVDKVEEEIAPSATNKTYDILGDDIDEEIEEEIDPTSDEENKANEVAQIVDQSEESSLKPQGNEEVQVDHKTPVGKYSGDSEAVPDVQYEENDLWNERRDDTGVTDDIGVQNFQKTEAGVNMFDLDNREEGSEYPESGAEQGNVVVDMISEEIVHEKRGYVGGLMGDLEEDSGDEETRDKGDEAVEDYPQQQTYLDEDRDLEGEGSNELHDHEREHEVENDHLESMGNDEDGSDRDSDKHSWDGGYDNEGQSKFIEKDGELFDETSHASMVSESFAEEMPNADNTPAIATSMHTTVHDVELDHSQAQESTFPDANSNANESPSNVLILGMDKSRLEGDVEERTENVDIDIVEEEMVVAAVSAPVHSKLNTDFYEKEEEITSGNEEGNESVHDGDAKIFSYPTKWNDEDHEASDNTFPDLMVKEVINDDSGEEDVSEKYESEKETNLEEANIVNSTLNTDFYEKEEEITSENEEENESISDGDAKIFSYPTKWNDEDHETSDTTFPDLMVKDVINDDSAEEDLSDEDEEQENIEVTNVVSETLASDMVQDTDIDHRDDVICAQVGSTEQSMPEGDLYHVEDDLYSQQSAYEEEFSQEETVPRSALVDKVLVRMLAEDSTTTEYVPSEDENEIAEMSAIQKEETEEDFKLREIRAGNNVIDESDESDAKDENTDIGSEAQSQEDITISSQEANVTESSPSVSAGAIYDSNQMTDGGSRQDTSQDLGDGVMDNSSSYDVTVSMNDDIPQPESDAEDITPADDIESETVGTQDHTATDASITDVSMSEQETKSDGSSSQSYLVVEPYERFMISDIDEADEENEGGAGSRSYQVTEGKDSDHVVESWFNTQSLSSEFGEGLTEEENRQKEAYEKWGEPVENNQIETSGNDKDVRTAADSSINAVIEETQMVPPNANEISEEVVGISSTQVESSSTKEWIQDGVETGDDENSKEVFLQGKYFENSFGEDVSDADSDKTNQDGELPSDDISFSEEREGETHKELVTTSTLNQGNTESDPDEEAVRSMAKEYVDQVVMDAAVSYKMSSNQHAMSNDEDIGSTMIPEATASAIFEQAAEEYIGHVVSHDDEGAQPKITEEHDQGQESHSEEGVEVNNSDDIAPEALVCRYTEPEETAMPFIMESGEDLEDTDEVPDLSAVEIMEQDIVVQEIVPAVESMPVTETAMAFVMESEQYASSDDEEEAESHDENQITNNREENGFDDKFSTVAQAVPQVRVTPALVTEDSSDSEISLGESGDVGEEIEEIGATAAVEELIAPVSLSEVQTNPTNFYHLSNDEDEFDDTYSDLLEESKKLESDIDMLSSDVTPEVDIHVSPAHDAAVIEDEMGSEFLPHIEPLISEHTQDVTEESVPSEEVIVPLQQVEVEMLPSQDFEEEGHVHGSEDETLNIEEVAREFVDDVIKRATKDYVESGHESAFEEPSNIEEVEGNVVQEETVPRDGDDEVFEEYDNFDNFSIPYQNKDAAATSAQSSQDYKKTVSVEESLVSGNLSADSDDDGEGSRITRPTELPLLTASGQGLLISPSKKSRLANATPAGMSPGSFLSGGTPVSLFTPDFESVASTPGSLSDQEAEALDTGSRLLPMSPFDKKSISVDESVTKNLDEEWDEKEAILNAIRAKQEEAERRNMQLEDPGMRQMSMDSEDSMKRMQGVSAEDEWQDDEYARHSLQGNKEGAKKSEESDSFYRRPVPEDERKAADGAEHTVTSDGVVLREKKLTRPNTLLNRLSIQSVNSVFSEGSIDLENISDDDEAEAEKPNSQSSQHGDPSGARPKEKRKIRAELSLNLDDTITSQHTDDGTTPAVLTPTSTEMSWEDDTPMNKAEPIEEYSAREEHEDRWRWRKVNLGGKDYTIDMKAINPYKKVLSHGGYYGEGLNAIIVFASCYLPEKSRKDYTYLMNNLFLYVVSTLELLVAQEYIIIYFHGSASSDKIPSLGWMRKCYQMIDRKLRKSLKGLYLVHPTTWLKAIVKLTKPFISAKFSNKLKFVKSLVELKSLVSMEYVYIPEEVKRVDSWSSSGRR